MNVIAGYLRRITFEEFELRDACLRLPDAKIAGRAPPESTGGHRGRGWLWYGLQLTGATSSGFPFLELIQPVAVSRHGH
jgi:hypothetical protein